MAILGNLALWLALLISAYSAFAFGLSVRSKNSAAKNSARVGVIAVAGLLTIAVIVLAAAIFTHNFRFEYVANETSLNTSPAFLVSALWAGNAGSLLFWAWVLSLFSVIAILSKWRKYPDLVPHAAMVLMITEFFFTLLLVAKLSPFGQLAVPPADGAGMNLMLQNAGMIFHPPALLAGYVVFAVPFAFAVSTMLRRNNSDDWLVATRNYTLIAWLLLGIGNIIGAWWAYVELGWGGYWAWDPVENAGLMPWLLATAFLHSSVMQRRKGSFRIWNLVLIVLTFSLVIFGTFLTRSGILNSVHTFNDTGMTPFFMTFIAIALFGPLILLYSRYDDFRSDSASESYLSREGTFILANILLVGTTAITLLGTIFPSITEALQGAKVSLDASFFNKVNGPIFMAIIVLAGICTLITWSHISFGKLLRKFLWPLVAAIVLGIILHFTFVRSLGAVIAISVCLLILFSILTEWAREAAARHRGTGENYFTSWWNLLRSSGQRYGGYTVHIGIILIAIGVIGSSFYSVDKEASLKVGDTININQYVLAYNGLTVSDTPDTTIVGAKVSVYNDGRMMGILVPQKTFQKSSNQPVTDVAIRYSLTEDLYVILESWQGNGTTADIKVLVNPLVSWIWVGGAVFLIGGLITFWPGRRKEVVPSMAKEEQTILEAVPVGSTVSASRLKAAEDEVEKQILNRRMQAEEACAKCGKSNRPNARFCAYCGQKLSGGRRNG